MRTTFAVAIVGEHFRAAERRLRVGALPKHHQMPAIWKLAGYLLWQPLMHDKLQRWTISPKGPSFPLPPDDAETSPPMDLSRVRFDLEFPRLYARYFVISFCDGQVTSTRRLRMEVDDDLIFDVRITFQTDELAFELIN